MADLLPTDSLLVNRAGVDYSVPQSDVMATVQDTDLFLVNRAGTDYNATYADVKKGFGPQGINPAPGDWTTGSAITGGTGTQADPFIVAAGTAAPAGATIQSGEIGTLTGLTPGGLIQWTVNAGGNRFKQDLAIVPAGGTVSFDLKYVDTPASTTGQTYNGELQIGTTYFKWDVSQLTATVDKPSIISPADNAGEMVQAISDEITAYDSGTKTLTLSGSKDLTVFKALDDVQQDSGYTPTTSAITNVDSTNPAAVVLTLTDDTDLANFRVGDKVASPAAIARITVTDVVGNVLNAQLAADTILRVPQNSVYNITEVIEKFEILDPGIVKLQAALSIAASCTYEITELVGGTTSTSMTGTITGGAPYDFDLNFTSKGHVTIKYTYSTSILDGSHILHYANTPNQNTINGVDMVFAGAGQNVFVQIGGTSSGPEATVLAIGPGNTLTFDKGGWSNGDTITGPTTTPATGTIASIDATANTMTLSVSDETSPKRWIVNQGKFVKGEETPSSDAAPDADGLTIQSSAFATTPPGALTQSDSDWQITLKTDTSYASVVDSSMADAANLTSWAPTGLAPETAYRCRVKHRSGTVESVWSDDVTFKTAVDLGPEVAADPGMLNIYNVQAAPTKFTSPVKFVNWACGTFLVAVGEDGKIYKGPTPAATSGSFALSSISLPAGELALDVYVSYQADPESTGGTTVILCKSGNVYIYGNATPVATDVKRIIKLGGVTRICMLEKNDGTYLGVNVRASTTYNVGTDTIAPNSVSAVTITMPADDNVIISLSALYGSYDAASSIICTEKGNLYLIAKDGTNLSEVGLPVGVKSNAAPYLITEAGWSALQGNASAVGSFSNCFTTSGGMWIRTNTDELYAVSFTLLNCWDGIATSAGPVKVLDNALSGVISIYGADHWFAIGKDGFAYDATKSRTLTKNTVAGAIFGPQGTGHASFNSADSNVYCIIDN